MTTSADHRERLFERYVDSATGPGGEYEGLPLTKENLALLRLEFEQLG